MAQIIALHGFAQSGKDTVAKFLEEEAGYKRLAFADALRDVLYALNPIIGQGAVGPLRLRTIVDGWSWDEAKVDIPEIRELLQRMGTEAGRKILGENVWVNIVLKQIKDHPGQRFVITDLRFDNEMDALSDYGADVLLVKIVRPGVGPVNSHTSDAGIEDRYFDVILHNNGSLDDLRDETVDLVDKEIGQLSLFGYND